MNKIIDFIIDSINASRERLKMSIVTFYIALLVLYHWRVFAILLFGGIPMVDKIEKIDLLYKDYTLWHYLLNPIFVLILAVSTMLLFPWITLKTDIVVNKILIKRKNDKEDVLINDRTKEIAKAEHEYFLLQISSGYKSTTEFVQEIGHLETANESLKKELANQKEEFESELRKEQENSRKSIENLKLGFKQVEENFELQIDELKRQNTRAVPDFIYFDLPDSYEINGNKIKELSDQINLILLPFTVEERAEIFNAILRLKISNSNNKSEIDKYSFHFQGKECTATISDFFSQLNDLGVVELSVYLTNELKGTINGDFISNVFIKM
ncbi:hypothetical protein ACPDHL_03435 [Myroides sp. C15-4]|uniref:hypothetical protein n=1 Tax=Myroides sp. C15-4 TaxID=3400532 RepID=UPI003D2F66C3